jgi:RNAse (barnase) inhibitor barstar
VTDRVKFQLINKDGTRGEELWVNVGNRIQVPQHVVVDDAATGKNVLNTTITTVIEVLAAELGDPPTLEDLKRALIRYNSGGPSEETTPPREWVENIGAPHFDAIGDPCTGDSPTCEEDQ